MVDSLTIKDILNYQLINKDTNYIVNYLTPYWKQRFFFDYPVNWSLSTIFKYLTSIKRISEIKNIITLLSKLGGNKKLISELMS